MQLRVKSTIVVHMVPVAHRFRRQSSFGTPAQLCLLAGARIASITHYWAIVKYTHKSRTNTAPEHTSKCFLTIFAVTLNRKENKMKCHIGLNQLNSRERQGLKKEMKRIVDAGQEDAGSRLQHLWVIAMLQAGLSPKTINRVAAILPMVCQRFAEYKTSQLADAWMKRLCDRE